MICFLKIHVLLFSTYSHLSSNSDLTSDPNSDPNYDCVCFLCRFFLEILKLLEAYYLNPQSIIDRDVSVLEKAFSTIKQDSTRVCPPRSYFRVRSDILCIAN